MLAPNEVCITKVWTVEAANEYSEKHDTTPNWRENGPLNHGAGTFALRIEAEVGATIGALGAAEPYNLIIQAACLTNPLAVLVDNLAGGGGENFGMNWESQASEEKYTKSWSIPFPTTPLVGFPPLVNEIGQTWQFFVSLVSIAAPAKFACTFASDPFMLL